MVAMEGVILDVIDDVLARQTAKDQDVEQGIAPQAIGAMDRGAGAFTRGVEPRYGLLASCRPAS
jgi:hypothetical protein